MDFICLPAGDRGILVQFKNEISEQVNEQIIALSSLLKEKQIPGVEEWVPGYCSLMVYYDPLKTDYKKLVNILSSLQVSNTCEMRKEKRIHNIPVLYGGETGKDLSDVAKINRLTEKEVIEIHSGKIYRVYMIGFAPGFPYLGGLDPRIHTPRLKSPRVKVEAGSVGIAGKQTGIYPLSTPGGWRIIGHTPLPLFQPDKEDSPSLIQAGDYIRFVPVTEEEYDSIKRSVEKGGSIFEGFSRV